MDKLAIAAATSTDCLLDFDDDVDACTHYTQHQMDEDDCEDLFDEEAKGPEA